MAREKTTREEGKASERAAVAKAESREREKADESRQKALARALDEASKRFGHDAVMKLGADFKVACDALPTGSLALDMATGIGGIPRGRVVEFFGPESSGKTTIALSCISQAQRSGGVAAFIDAEHALDPSYARKLGVDLDNLLVSQPDNGEQALEICDLLVRSGAVDVVVIDSVAALTPRAEIEGEMGQNHVGLQARLMSQGLRKLTSIVKKSNTSVIFINQIRMKIGVMFGSPETTPGGNALKFYASLRLDIRRIGTVKRGDEVVGSEVKIKVVKNKVAPPFRVASTEILFDRGINRAGEIADMGVECGILQKTGAWLSYGDMRLGMGRDKAIEFLLANPEVCREIETRIREHWQNNAAALTQADAEAEAKEAVA